MTNGFFNARSHVEDLRRDIRHVSRGLRRTPGFAIAVIVTLALGIGGNTAIFSVVDQVLLRPVAAGPQMMSNNAPIAPTGIARPRAL